jgi:3-hydroxyacyl-[acyl-carrier-protein] dehydratase
MSGTTYRTNGYEAAADVGQVVDALPHRYPMLLVDRIVELVPGVSITAVKAVTVNEPWFAGGTATAYPQALVIESWCQAACILAARPSAADDRMPLLGALSGVRLLGPVRPGDLLTHRARVTRAFADTWMFAGESLVDGSVVLEMERLTLALRPFPAAKTDEG